MKPGQRIDLRNLRKKIEPDPADPTYIATVKGFGYRFGAGRKLDGFRAKELSNESFK